MDAEAVPWYDSQATGLPEHPESEPMASAEINTPTIDQYLRIRV
ncbi:hypothetical protein [Kitasatospora humi]|nr:hypothetical protein [Kitasatospora humi]